MTKLKTFCTAVALTATLLAGAAPAVAQTAQDTARFRAAQDRFNNEMQVFRAEFDRYQASVNRGPGGWDDRDPRNDPRYNDPRNDGYSDERDEGNYDPSHYYRDGSQYQERVLTSDDRVYRGNDGRYYCKRNDGTTGLIVGGASGAILGNVIDGGHSRAVGTILGGLVGAVAGKAIDQGGNKDQIRCR